MTRADELARGLVAHLRRSLGASGLELAEGPTPLGGGFDTEILALRLRGAPSAWAGPLVLRILRPHHDPGRVLREEATQNALADLGYPAPRVLLATREAGPLGAPFLVMRQLPGGPLMERPPGIVGVLLDAQLRLHALDPSPLARVLGDVATFDGYLAALERRIDRAGLTGLAPVMAWLRGRPRPDAAPVICHGDLHPQNVLVEGRRLSGVLDWPNVLVADPAFDVASTHLILRFVPAELISVPRSLRWLLRVGQRLLAHRYLAGYRRRRSIGRERLAYYETAAAMRALVQAGESRRRAVRELPLSALDRSPYAARLLTHVRTLTGVPADLPPPPW
jgi:aminoglycoside phosphotransferase (APT) family kinase protein